MSKRGRIIEQAYIVRQDLRANPKRLYVFGDNMIGVGLGGQAGEMRNEPNAVGIPTKWKPENKVHSFFYDRDFPNVKASIDEKFDLIEAHLAAGGDVVWPAQGVGTGLANLQKNAPTILAYIRKRKGELDAGPEPRV